MPTMLPQTASAPMLQPCGPAAEATAPIGRTLALAYRAPLDWHGLAAFLAMRAVDGVESVEPMAHTDTEAHGHRPGPGEPVYRRILRVPAAGGADRLGWIEVTRPGGRRAGRGLLVLRVDPALVTALPTVRAQVRRVFDLDCRPRAVADALGTLARGHEGTRLPGAFDGFEIAVRAILGQQITVRQARVLAGRFVAAFGERVATPWPALTHAFPGAAAVCGRDPSEIGLLGVTRQRSRTILELAGALADGSLVLEPGVDVAATIARLRAVRGVGDWTAQYLAMRALRWPDAFPAADVAVMKALGVTTSRAAAAAADAWRPWRGYAVIHLWRRVAVPPSQESAT